MTREEAINKLEELRPWFEKRSWPEMIEALDVIKQEEKEKE